MKRVEITPSRIGRNQLDQQVVEFIADNNPVEIEHDIHTGNPTVYVEVPSHPVLMTVGFVAALAVGVYGGAWGQRAFNESTESFAAQKSMHPTVAATLSPSTEAPTPAVSETASEEATPSATASTEATPSQTPEAKLTSKQCIAKNFTPAQQLGQLTVLGVYSNTKDANNMKEVAKVFDKYSVGAVVVMNQPDDIYSTNAKLTDFKKSQKISPLIYVDQEGGTVQRIGYPSSGKRILSQEAVGKLSEKKREQYIEDVIAPMYQFLKEKGFDGVLAPVGDLGVKKNSPLPGRTFSTDPKVVGEILSLYVKAANDAGIGTVVKHLPGLGEAKRTDGKLQGNTDDAPMVTPDWEQIKERSLAPYKQLMQDGRKTDAMMGTQIVKGLSEEPAALSSEAVKVVREILGDDVLIMTDDLNTPSIAAYEKSKGITSGIISAAAIQALKAGVDQVMIVRPNAKTWQTQLTQFADKGSELMKSDSQFRQSIIDRVEKVLKAKGVDPCTIS